MTTETRVPSDEKARNRIRDGHEATLFVEAGAGTGKTTSLVDRIVELVGSGAAELQHLAAITFTEAAAAELRDRVRQALEESAATDVARRERFEAALRQIDTAAIQTLHGFAQRILALYPLEAGLPPRLEILDPVRARIAFAERWERLLDELLSDDSHGLPIVEAMALGLEVKQLQEVAKEFHEHYDKLASGRFEAPAAELDIEPIYEALERAAATAECCVDESDKLMPFFAEANRFGEMVEAVEDDFEQLLRLLTKEVEFKTGNSGAQRNWQGITPKQARDDLKGIEAARQTVIARYRAALLGPLLDRLRRFALDFAAERRALGMLEFHDLLVMARDLLRDNPEVRGALRDRYRRLLIDEFQDTDPIQLEIAALLATNDPEVGDRDWRDLPIEPGRLFFVGDPKQAIYHFRGADIELYQEARARFGAEEVHLQQNFRTVPGVIAWVNALFQQVIGDGDGNAQPPYVDLDPWREARVAGPGVYLLGGPSQEATLDLVRRAEATEIVDTIRAVKAEGWPIVDRVTGEERPARYEDVTVLLPARTTLSWLERALEDANVPYRVESRSLLYETQEVRDLTNILAAIDDPTDEVSLVAALRSPAFACADDELYAWVQARGRWDYRSKRPEAIVEAHPVAQAMVALRTLHEERWQQGLNALVERVIRERKMFELGYAFRRPRERWQRLRFVLDQARAFADAGGATLREFVAWLRQQAEEDVSVVDTVVAHADDDAVRILTIHAAKGLEFPIVVMAGLNTGKPRASQVALWTSAGLPEAKVGPAARCFATEGYGALEEREQRLSAFEKVRLLYVGATRARDYLFVSAHHKPSSYESHASLVWGACAWIPDLWKQYSPPAIAAGPDGAAEADDATLDEAAWQAARTALLKAAGRPTARAATDIAKANEPEEPATGVAPWRRGRAATNVGRAVHATLQSIDLRTGDELETVARAQAAAEGIPSRAGEVAALARAALSAPSVRQAVAGRSWREVYVGAEIDGVVVEGFIDLLYETDTGLVVVDYKTDSVRSDEEIDAAMGRYRLQGATYALALSELAERLGQPVVAFTFVFLRTRSSAPAGTDGAGPSGGQPEPRERTVSGAELTAAVAEVRRLVATGR